MGSAMIDAHGTTSLSVVVAVPLVLATTAETSPLLCPSPPSVVVVVAPSVSVPVVRKLVKLSLLLC